ncbi:MAG: hypothetical protein AAFQ42_08565 [Pseudomonadota bacterium]
MAATFTFAAQHVLEDAGRAFRAVQRRHPDATADAAWVALEEIDHATLIELHAILLGSDRDEIAARLSGTSCIVNYHKDISGALCAAGHAVGLFLAYREAEDVAFVYGVALAMARRRTRLSPALKYFGIQQCVRAGIRDVRFQIMDGAMDTVAYVRRLHRPAKQRDRS